MPPPLARGRGSPGGRMRDQGDLEYWPAGVVRIHCASNWQYSVSEVLANLITPSSPAQDTDMLAQRVGQAIWKLDVRRDWVTLGQVVDFEHVYYVHEPETAEYVDFEIVFMDKQQMDQFLTFNKERELHSIHHLHTTLHDARQPGRLQKRESV
eukprot:60490-Rhodomonas_salina.3